MMATRRASASQIALYQKCPAQWFMKYKLKLKEPSTPALIKGSLNHSCTENFFSLNPRTCDINLRNYEQGFMDYGMEVFEQTLTEPRKVFGKSAPSYKKELSQLCADEFDLANEIVDARIITQNYIKFYTMQFQQYAMKYGNFPQAFYMSRPKFQELEIKLPNFLGFIDNVTEKDDEVIVTDYKTSQLYKTGFNPEYIQQLKLYAWGYKQIYDVIPDLGSIHYLRYGRECVIQINKDTIMDEMETLVNWFLDSTESDSPEDYPMNSKHQFCTNCQSKNPNGFKNGGGCWYAQYCNKELQNIKTD